MFSLIIALIYLGYLTFGLPNPLLGSVWPMMHSEFGVPVGYSGIVFILITISSVFATLLSGKLSIVLKTQYRIIMGFVLTAGALFGFSLSHSFAVLCIFAVPYGFGAGTADAALNNYMAVHYHARYLTWMHCMWGLGAIIGPYVMSGALKAGLPWNSGYLRVGSIEIFVIFIFVVTLPVWKRKDPLAVCKAEETAEKSSAPSSLLKTLKIRGVIYAVICFFCIGSIEQTVNLWASSFLVDGRGLDSITAAGYASLMFIGVTAGRVACGFITMKLNDKQMVILGQIILACGIIAIMLPLGVNVTLAGLIAVGLGLAPIYPSLTHAAPVRFGSANSQSVIGLQMAGSYCGALIMSPLFGAIAGRTTIKILPVFLAVMLTGMVVSHLKLAEAYRERAV